METFHDEAQRYDYPLTANSLVLDIGCYHGTFSEGIHQKYGCRVLAFEPIKQYFEIARARLAGRASVSVFNYGVGPADARLPIAVAGDWSSLYLTATVKKHEEVEIKGVDSVLGEPVDLLKINIEGAEYDLLDAMIDRGLMTRVNHAQIQFHTYGGGGPGAVARRAAIRERLKATHDEKWCSDFIWESWSRR